MKGLVVSAVKACAGVDEDAGYVGLLPRLGRFGEHGGGLLEHVSAVGVCMLVGLFGVFDESDSANT